jgi:hypothetical protein
MRPIHDLGGVERLALVVRIIGDEPLVLPVIEVGGRIQPHPVVPIRAFLARSSARDPFFILAVPIKNAVGV